VLIGDPRPEDQLERLLMDKKRLVAERIKTVQEQETSKAQARTEQLKKEIQRTKEVQDAQRQKELVVIGSQREVEVAKQVAERETIEQRKLQDLAVIQKEKELAIAKSELGIQQANSEAAKYAAQAIAAKGKAEAEVLAAMYRAKAQNKEIFLAEKQAEVSQTLYTNLKDFKVKMPENYIGGGGGSGKLTSNLDVITGFSALGVMGKALKAAEA
jgi:membrane protein involved in colicin uptake